MIARLRLLTFLVAVLGAEAARADKLVIRDAGGERTYVGNALGADSSGAVMFETRDAQLLIVPKDRVVKQEKSSSPTPLWTRTELKTALAEEYGKDFRVTETGHYIIVHSCSVDTARDAGKLLNRAQAVFLGYFLKNGDFRLQKPRQPLIAVFFEDRRHYVEHVTRYLGPNASMTQGVYIPSVNRIFFYNAFGGDAARKMETAVKVDPRFASHLSAKMVEQNISTLIHEAIHQAAYNTGFHNRKIVDLPVWLVEGMAMYFETTDVNAKHGWKGGRTINPDRANRFRAANRRGFKKGFLEELIVDDSILRDPATAADGYAIAWTLTYYLLKHHQKEYMDYVRLMNARKELTPYSRAARLKDFETAFKMPPSQMEPEFLSGAMKLLDAK
jgi:hypothetical protein